MRWAHINGSYNLLTRLQTIMLDGHFVIEQTTRNRSGNFFNFNGTAGIWRREAIEMSGGWQHDTLTEDTDLSFRAQLMGWRFVYLLDEEAPAEIPVDINAFKAQQRRWAKGVLQVWFKLYKRIWGAPLPLRVKLEMFFRLTGNISYPLMIVASFMQFPLLLVRYNQGLYQLMILDVPLLFFSTVSVVLFYGSAVWYLDKKRGSRMLHLPLVMGLGIGLAFSNARAVFEALFGVKSDFVRTPKYRVEEMKDESWKHKKYKRKHGWLPLLELSKLSISFAVIGFPSSLNWKLLRNDAWRVSERMRRSTSEGLVIGPSPAFSSTWLSSRTVSGFSSALCPSSSRASRMTAGLPLNAE
jgi:cellulose synthase/poly-beta-1,6-N-acetylglucosamine synthase-like glycosyltransferase